MSYSINYKIWDNFLRVDLAGELDLDKFYLVTDDIDSVIDANGIDKVLIDMRKFKQRFGVFDGLNKVEAFRQVRKLVQFAIVDIIANKEKNDFFENASFNRGFKLLFFYEESEALNWLQVTGESEPQKVFLKEF